MQVTDGKVYATLTEVKNLIGDVFSAVDKYGEVTITSYNKPKYTISVVPSILVEETAAAQPAEIVPVVDMTAEAIEPVSMAAPDVVVLTNDLPPVQIETTANVEIAEAEATETPVLEVVVADTVAETPKAEPKIETIDLTQIFIDAAPAELWDRNGPREIAWVEKVRNLT